MHCLSIQYHTVISEWWSLACSREGREVLYPERSMPETFSITWMVWAVVLDWKCHLLLKFKTTDLTLFSSFSYVALASIFSPLSHWSVPRSSTFTASWSTCADLACCINASFATCGPCLYPQRCECSQPQGLCGSVWSFGLDDRFRSINLTLFRSDRK